ncbi:glycine cleavage system protein GcvH [Fodinicola acaciae]|uniref:glycine cleavage system protein GcvH n=1 Tax=Fodinicola acaciae TaxID=2681555 RepID=UPI0013CF9970|nr:glycine cleavage system protein GcvH [Fodinicola acaciae]
MATSDTPDQLRYTSEHEWVDAGGDWKIGITAYAQDSLGDIVFVQLPEVGATVEAGDPIGEIESTKSVSELYAPVSGTVAARNDALEEQPELVNSDPYGQGWILQITPSDPGAADNLLDAAAYQALIAG